MKASKKTIRIIAICVLIFIILGIGVYSFVKEGIRIVNTSAADIELFEKDDKLYFTDSTDRNIVFCYNPKSKKIEKLSYEKLKYEDSEYKFIHDYTGFKSVNKISGEEYYILDIEKAREEDGFAEGYGILSYSVSDIYKYKNRFYFKYTESIRTQDGNEQEGRFCCYDPVEKNLQELNTFADIGVFTINNSYMYYVSKDENATKINMVNLETLEQQTLVTYYSEISIDSLSCCEKGIYYRSFAQTRDYRLCLYDKTTEELEETALGDNGFVFTYNETDGYFYAAAFENNSVRVLYKISNDLQKKDTICEEIKLPFTPKHCQITAPVAIEDKIYFAVYSGWDSDDSYAVYSVDQYGKMEFIKKRRKHFMRNIF